jgi:hypothetical protein
VGGPVGQLALDPSHGALGGTNPSGSATYFELSDANSQYDPLGPTPGVVFDTAALAAPLRLTGQMEADLWLEVDRPDANVVVGLERFDADGNKEEYGVGNYGDVSVIGIRSTRFRDPIQDGWFRQATPSDPPVTNPVTGETHPFELKVRLFPHDLAIPVGGKLRLTVSGSYTRDSGLTSKVHPDSNVRVTVLADCQGGHVSMLRFGMPHPQAPLLNVREGTATGTTDQPHETAGALTSTPGVIGPGDGGGLAAQEVCGRAPVRDEIIGPSRPPADLTR